MWKRKSYLFSFSSRVEDASQCIRVTVGACVDIYIYICICVSGCVAFSMSLLFAQMFPVW